jgi:hypothetical protein
LVLGEAQFLAKRLKSFAELCCDLHGPYYNGRTEIRRVRPLMFGLCLA